MFSRLFFLLLLISIFSFPSAYAENEIALLQKQYPAVSAGAYLSLPAKTDLRGWDNLVIKLINAGVPQEQVLKIYSSKSFPKFAPVYFGLNPGESKNLYRNIANSTNAIKVRKFISSHKAYFNRANKEFGVNPEIIASLLYIESRFGANTGRESAIYRLSRLANINDPKNLQLNYARAKKMYKSATLNQVIKRAHYLEDTFLPEVVALFNLSADNKLSVLDIRGSSAGAFGWPQFLPTSYQKYAVDYDGDGRKSLYSAADSIGSVARYLSSNGWKKDISYQQKRAVIWTYNKSNPYIDAALLLAENAQKN